jgi:hypothetical protein
MPNVMAHPASGEGLDLEPAWMARFEEEEEEGWGADREEGWDDEDDLDEDDEWDEDDDDWDDDDDDEWNEEEGWDEGGDDDA